MFPVGNILNRGHIYFQDFWKCSSILNKAKQLQFNRKQKLNQKKGERSPPGPYLARPVTPYIAPGGRGACSPRAGHAPATSCFCRRAHQLRLDSLVLPTEPRIAGGPASPPSPSSSTSGTRAISGRFVAARTSPSSLTPSPTPM